VIVNAVAAMLFRDHRKQLIAVIAFAMIAYYVEAVDCNKACNPTDPQYKHKNLTPLDSSDWGGFICSCLGLLLAAGGGIGGGGMLVPIYILIMNFLPKEAVPLSNCTILGGSVANCILNLQKRQKKCDRPLIDFDIVNVMEPMTIAGAVLGSLINKLLPGWILTLMLMVVLGLITQNTYGKGVKRWKKEDKEFAEAAEAKQASDPTDSTMMLSGQPKSSYSDLNEMEMADVVKVPEYPTWDKLNRVFLCQCKTKTPEQKAKEAQDEAEKLKEEQAEQLKAEVKLTEGDNAARVKEIQDGERSLLTKRNLSKFSILCICWVGVNLLDMFRGGGGWGGPFDVSCGSAGYWVLTFSFIPFTAGIAFIVARQLIREVQEKKDIGYPFQEGDVKWDSRKAVIYPLVCSTAGILAGMFGVGGGIVKGPLMLEMGCPPTVASATAAFMIFFTASSATLSYALYGMIIWSYAFPLIIIGFVCTVVGQIIVNKLVKMTGRESIIAFIIAAILGVSTLMLSVNGFASAYDILHCGCSESLEVCPSPSPAFINHTFSNFHNHSHLNQM